MKIVINACYGGFSLSLAGIKRFAELKGRECYFFSQAGFDGNYTLVEDPYDPSVRSRMFLSAFDIKNPTEVIFGGNHKRWNELTNKERGKQNKLYRKHSIGMRDPERNDPDLIKVVEELGEKANGECAKLKIVEIPDGIEWEISEYDGIESVEEKHRSWN